MSDLSYRDDETASVSVSSADTELFTYVYQSTANQYESPRPFIHPLRTLGGRLISIYRPHDHLWHVGIAWSLPHFGADNFWGGPSFRADRGYVSLDNNGATRHRRTNEIDVTDGVFGYAHDLDWYRSDGTHVVTEARRLTARVEPGSDAWILTFETSMTNVSGSDIQIGSPTTEGRPDAGYGGLFWRGPRSFTGGTVLGPDGATGETLRGRHAPWMAFTGKHDELEGSSSIVMVDAPSNAQHPPQWFARSEPFGCLGPAPFFSEEVRFGSGEVMTNRYAVVVADGKVDHHRAAALADLGGSVL
ncbi:DUF6807 domain-containing protein [Kribbella deserti]|uniref:PmoA family protein n=1 Tax=Kribbella deserti TaxID=1926257 RepID=A0ABV6QNL4_9ACTN